MELNLSKEQSIQNLNLRKEKLGSLCLDKPVVMNQKARVALVLDYSGSMRKLYNDGIVQQTVERLLPVAMQFDDNGTMEMWIFENGYTRLPDINLNNFYGYVEKEIIKKGYRMGGTSYAPVMEDISHKYLKEEPANIPDYVMFITDGDNSDKANAKKVISELSHYPIFWQFIGIGHDKFEFLEKLDDLGGRYVDNANFFSLKDLDGITDDDLYRKLLAEYPSWLTCEKVQKMLNTPIPPVSHKGFFGKLFH